MPENGLIPAADIEQRIYLIRGQRFMLDRDLAQLYGLTRGLHVSACQRGIRELEITDCDVQAIMRAFVKFREMLATHQELADKLAELEQRYGEKFRVVFEAIRQLMTPPTLDRQRRQIGAGGAGSG